MTRRSFVKAASFLFVVLIVALVPALMPASQAHAQMRICKSHSTDSHDRARLRTAMQKPVCWLVEIVVT